MAFDLLIRNGTVIDGTGLPRFVADVAIKDGRIAEVGAVREGAGRVLDAEGLVVAPGIIDLHTHYDAQIIWDPLLTSSCYHGVTTVVSGNCSYTLAPVRPEDHEWLAKLYWGISGIDVGSLMAGIDWSWERFPEYLARLERGIGLNYVTYVGHSAVRRYVMGEAASERAATEDEIARMRDLVREAMAAGAWGFSTSQAPSQVGYYQEPIPSALATEAEILELGGVVGAFKAGNIAVLPRSLYQGVDAADRALLIALARRSRRPVVIQGGGRPITEAAAAGVQVFTFGQVRPYDRLFYLKRTGNFNGLPYWRELLRQPFEEMVRQMRDESVRVNLRYDVDHPNTDPKRGQVLPIPPWTNIYVHRVARPENKPHEGKSIAALAAEQGKHIADAFLDLALAEDLETEFRFVFVWDAEQEAQAAASFRHPYLLVGTSDAGGHLDREDGTEFSTIFLRRWALDKGVLSLEEAIHKLTFVPAAVVGLPDRGLLRPGYAADLMIFDPAQVRMVSKRQVQDLPAGGWRYQAIPTGYRATIVNGAIVVEDGKPTGRLPGKVLRS